MFAAKKIGWKLQGPFPSGMAISCGSKEFAKKVNAASGGRWFEKPIKNLSDFKGMKFHTAGIRGEILTEPGAAVVQIPGLKDRHTAVL
ncbi:MAG: hypothetical protein JRG73_15010 [Deltaproteobacteria bacterium]|nr:hypothetical protein [Deltaproteobacteria bacterium]